MPKNFVTAGDYEGKNIMVSGKKVFINDKTFGFGKKVYIDKNTTTGYEVIGSDTTKSATSAVGRGAVGAAILGPLGLVAGSLSAKNKGSHLVAVQFNDGKRSLLEIDSNVLNILIKRLF